MEQLSLFDTRHVADWPGIQTLYNRINSAGKRVESEEKAFATLVWLHPATGQWVRDLFHDIHGVENAREDKLDSRDEVLERKKERNFGFKLFIRTFIQVCAHYFNYSVGSNTFSFEVLNDPRLQDRLRADSVFVEKLFRRAREVLTYVRNTILRDGLLCDDLQMLPETTSLLPDIPDPDTLPGTHQR